MLLQLLWNANRELTKFGIFYNIMNLRGTCLLLAQVQCKIKQKRKTLEWELFLDMHMQFYRLKKSKEMVWKKLYKLEILGEIKNGKVIGVIKVLSGRMSLNRN